MKSEPVPIVDKLPGARLREIYFYSPGRAGKPRGPGKPDYPDKACILISTPSYITLTSDRSQPPEPEAKESKLDKELNKDKERKGINSRQGVV